MALTEEAKSEIAKAIRIVREDKFEQYTRTVIGRHAAPKEEEEKKPVDDGLEKKEDETKPPPPEKEKEEKVEENATKRIDRWWGEIEG
jgi:hypothetical protein